MFNALHGLFTIKDNKPYLVPGTLHTVQYLELSYMTDALNQLNVTAPTGFTWFRVFDLRTRANENQVVVSESVNLVGENQNLTNAFLTNSVRNITADELKTARVNEVRENMQKEVYAIASDLQVLQTLKDAGEDAFDAEITSLRQKAISNRRRFKMKIDEINEASTYDDVKKIDISHSVHEKRSKRNIKDEDKVTDE